QYIIGHVDFYDCRIYVNKNVLIPRQETEILIETILNNYGMDKKINILDIGTGSGAIAIALAKKMVNSNAIAIDISETALDTAKKNSVINNVENIEFRLQDIKQEIAKEFNERFDLIVSNPPYVSSLEYETIQKEIKEFEPRLAVTDNGDGYEFYDVISNKGRTLLKSGGTIYFEVGKGQSEKVSQLLEENLFSEIKVYQDLQKINRVVSGIKL
ncbi:MAG: peptide chain release factor N(5)-glutamine methyltransferase, partial [Melioribacteraceae bacterium]|nr:peptide chain release factor N(5)-glutamine methyltransferase [Melioribacteraceae bacterium]